MAAALVAAAAVAVGTALLDRDERQPQRATAPADAGPRPRPAAPSARAEPGLHTPVPSTWRRPRRGPAFAIARVRPGRRVAFSSAPGGPPAGAFGARTEFGSPRTLGVVRRRGRFLGVETAELANGRLAWVREDPRDLLMYWTRYSLRADLSQRTLVLRYGGRTLRRFPVTVGGPGSVTPAGRFAITDALAYDASPYYGCCVLALSGRQPNLPPGWLGGDRIAIHGTPGPVGQAASSGCIRATDATMRLLFDRVPLGTPVFVRA